MQYNVRNWTKSITSPLFSQTLYYNDKRENGTLNTPTYNGNISGMDWTGGKGYNFAYDHLSRLTNAAYLENNVGSTKFNTSYSYDKHGNMLTLSRNGNQTAAIDNLTFSYRGNQLMRTDDTGENSTIVGSMDFCDGTNTGDDYAYDVNGNLIKDSNKNIVDIQYNILNLPSKVTFGDGNSVSYMYAADGRKLQTVHTINGTTTTTDYAGNMIYENGTLKRTLVDGGYYENGEYYFYLKDHLGNNRVVAKQDGTVVQTNDYYPYGMEFASNTNGTVQPYKYNGKELDTKCGLNLYDYGARHYDPVLGRFMTVDLMAEKYYSWSPYTYCLNNPMIYMDPDGRDPKKLSHWIRFGKETAKAISVVASVGLQVAGEVELGSKKVGGDMNLISQDVAGVKDGVFFHPCGNFDKAETKQGVELGAGLVGVSVQKKIKEESGDQMLEEQQSVSLGLLEYTNTETTPIDHNYRTVGKTQKTSETKTADLSVKGKAIIGIELSLDLNKIWDALGNLLLDK